MRRTLFVLALLVCGCADKGVEDDVRALMRDPDAVKFQEVRRCPRDAKLWTGQLNAKNGFGAYSGFEPFFYDGELILRDHGRFEGTVGRCFGIEALPDARSYLGEVNQSE